MPGPLVTTDDRVALRTAEDADRPFLQRGVANAALRRPMGSPVMNRDEFDDYVEGTDDRDWFVVCLDEDDAGPGYPADGDTRRIGSVVVDSMSYKRPELAYWLVPDAQGKGHGKRAVSLTIDYVFGQYDTPAVGASAFAFNDASRGLLESLGFTEEGRRRKYMFVDGEHRDMVHYGLLREEWREEGN